MRDPSARAFASTAALFLSFALGCMPGCDRDGAPAPRGSAPGDAPDRSGEDSPATSLEDAAAAHEGEIDAPDAGEVGLIHIVGRHDARDPAGPRLSWPATQLRVRFSGPALSLVLADTGTSHYDVAIDGAAPGVLVVSGAPRTYVVARDLGPGEHEVVLTKRTESFTGVTQLLGVEGQIVPSPAPSGRRIELVGDSITCGYGVLGDDASCPFSPDTEAEPLAWGALASGALGAMRAVTAISGRGVVRNFDGQATDTMPEVYGRALADDATSAWDHAGFTPDVVVVNLGTNDFAGGKGDPGPAFEAAYASFLAELRQTHAAAAIVVATSPMLSGESRARHQAHLERAIAARARSGDAKVSLLVLPEQREIDGYGCGYHPSIATQQKMAAMLVVHLRAVLGW